MLGYSQSTLFWRQLDTLPDDVHKLAHCEVCRHKVLFLVDGRDVALVGLLDDAGNPVRVLLPDAVGLLLALLKGMLCLELRGGHLLFVRR